MSGVVDFGEFEGRKCSSCGFYWDYNIFDISKLKSEFDRMFFTDIDFCPNCYYVGNDVSVMNERVKSEIDSGKYKKLLKPFNKTFAIATRQDAFQFIVYAMICEECGEYLQAAHAFHNGAIIEQDTIEKYVTCELYSKKDEKDRRLYENKVEEYFEASERNIRKYLETNNDLDAKIFLCGILKKLGKEQDFKKIFVEIVSQNKFSKEQVVVLKELRGE